MRWVTSQMHQHLSAMEGIAAWAGGEGSSYSQRGPHHTGSQTQLGPSVCGVAQGYSSTLLVWNMPDTCCSILGSAL